MKERQQTLPHQIARGERRLYPHELIEGQPFVVEPPTHLRTPRPMKQEQKWIKSKQARRDR